MMAAVALVLALVAVFVSLNSAYRLARMLKKLRDDLFEIIDKEGDRDDQDA